MQAPDNDPHTDGTGSALLAFCRWLHDQGFVSKPSGLQPALQCAPDPVAGDWQTPRCPPPRVDGLLSQFIKSCTRLQPIIVSQFRKAVGRYLTYLDDPAGFEPVKAARSRRLAQAATAAGRNLAAAPAGRVLGYPFPLRPTHVVWLRLPADLTRDEAHCLIAFIHTLTADATQGPPDPATVPEAATASLHP